MEVTVIKEFVDKYTGELHEKGSSFSCGKDRFEEIKNAGDFIKESSKKERKPKNNGNN